MGRRAREREVKPGMVAEVEAQTLHPELTEQSEALHQPRPPNCSISAKICLGAPDTHPAAESAFEHQTLLT